ncbi:hypothetical protein H5410_036530 [Solanum commersonii]|uniref:Uncharacterized protein n=1 Tax=Solanum commersonii TaxID=4109 RepID=A0A9J5Y5K0_SOLCO|nr:hypothetical protein H5410_036530 [Solanum commersonii]
MDKPNMFTYQGHDRCTVGLPTRNTMNQSIYEFNLSEIGPFSFNDLLTVNEKQRETFKEATKERGLLESDNTMSKILGEVVIFKMPSTLRSLFAAILVHYNPTDVRKLWDTYYEDVVEVFNMIYGNSHNPILHYNLNNIDHCLESMGKNIDIYDLPQLDHHWLEVVPSKCREINEEMSVKISMKVLPAESKLNPEQEQAFSKIVQTFDTLKVGIFFVDGPGELGKHLYVVHCFPVLDEELQFSKDIRNTLEIRDPLQTNESTMKNMPKHSGAAKLIRKPTMII